jgi:exosome complex RNA-binding protein Csl4
MDLCILDVVKTQGLVELSKLPYLINMQQPAAAAAGSSKKAAKRAAAESQQQQQQQLAVGQEVQGMVHFIKDHYVVVSLVQQQQRKKAKNDSAAAAAGSTDASKQQQQQYSHHGIGFIARCDFNSQGPAGLESRRFAHGQVVAAKVAALPSGGNGGRVLLEVRFLRSVSRVQGFCL